MILSKSKPHSLLLLFIYTFCAYCYGQDTVVPVPGSKAPKSGLQLGTRSIFRQVGEAPAVIIGKRAMLLDQSGVPTGKGVVSDAFGDTGKERIVWNESETAMAVEFVGRIGGSVHFIGVQEGRLYEFPAVAWKQLVDPKLPSHEITRVYPKFIQWTSADTCVITLQGTAVTGDAKREGEVVDYGYTFELRLASDRVEINQVASNDE